MVGWMDGVYILDKAYSNMFTGWLCSFVGEARGTPVGGGGGVGLVGGAAG